MASSSSSSSSNTTNTPTVPNSNADQVTSIFANVEWLPGFHHDRGYDENHPEGTDETATQIYRRNLKDGYYNQLQLHKLDDGRVVQRAVAKPLDNRYRAFMEKWLREHPDEE